MKLLLDDLKLFVTLVDKGSLTAAAAELGMAKSKLSRHLAQLEQQLNSQLLIRTTRKQSLTESGELLYHHCKDHIAALESVEDNIGELLNKPSGKLAVLFPLAFFANTVNLLITEFAKHYPDIQLTCHHYANNQPDKNTLSKYDLIFLLHEDDLDNNQLIGKTLMSFPQSIFAASQKDIEHIKTIEDLQKEPSIVAQSNEKWLFRDNQNTQLKLISPPIRITLTSPEMRREAVYQNLGIAKLPNYACQGDCQMKRIPLTEQPIAQRLTVLYHSRNIAFKTRTFLDFIQSNIGRLN